MRKIYLMVAALAAVIAIMMIVAPSECIKVCVIVLGVAAIISGLHTLMAERVLIEDEVFQKAMLVRGIVSIATGALAVLLPLFLAGVIWTVMLYTIAVYLLLFAASEIFGAAKLKAANLETRASTIEVAVAIVTALLLFCMPAKIGTTIIRIGGVALLVLVVVFVCYEWKNRPLVIEAEILSDNDRV